MRQNPSMNSYILSDSDNWQGFYVLLVDFSKLFSLNELTLFLILLIVGVIILFLLRAVLGLIVPAVAAVVIWVLTHNLIYAGAAFVVVAILQLILGRR